jgi:methylenetetrahydrofolate reductase (NADPH)
MALRGDPPRGETEFTPAPDGLAHAADLVALIKSRHPDICCGVAGYPETHPEAPDLATDLRLQGQARRRRGLRQHAALFRQRRLLPVPRRRARRRHPRPHPARPHARRVARAARPRARLQPRHRARRAARRAGRADPAAARSAGIAWLVAQIDGLIAHGAPGIHLYILNQAKTVLDPRLAECLARWRTVPPSPLTIEDRILNVEN